MPAAETAAAVECQRSPWKTSATTTATTAIAANRGPEAPEIRNRMGPAFSTSDDEKRSCWSIIRGVPCPENENVTPTTPQLLKTFLLNSPAGVPP
mmetsp:Transcript_131333/g.262060  ORF Transcript_131333/g.262060 Transcript_131333/m.262060 type:complete len:95 (-) Transcript_131333:789-1073(-)